MTRRALTYGLAALALILALVGLWLTSANRSSWDGDVVILLVFYLGAGAAFGLCGVLVSLRQPSNPIGWLFLAISIAFVGPVAAQEYGIRTLLTNPGARTWPGLAFLLGEVASQITLVAIIFVLLLFPDGRASSARWRNVVRWLLIAVVAFAVLKLLVPRNITDVLSSRLTHLGISAPNPLGITRFSPLTGPTAAAGGWVTLTAFALSVISLFQRRRHAGPLERLQLRWLAWTVIATITWVVCGILVLGALNLGESDVAGTIYWSGILLFVCFGLPAAMSIAVLRYRLYDIDIVINKAIVYASLAAFITLAYVAIVVGVGTILGDRRDPALSIAATALVALLFGPVRDRVRHIANRLVYGKRATPYEVMAGFSRRVSGTISVDDVIPEMAEAAARGVGASGSRVQVDLPDGSDRTEIWPAGSIPQDHYDRSFDVAYQGEHVGTIEVMKPVGEPMRPGEEALLRDLAGQAGLAMHNVRLTEELTLRARELAVQAEGLRISRERLVTARDAQRRGLERDIRDGPDRQLRDLRAGVGRIRVDASEADEQLEILTERANDTLEALRDLARGIFPPLLADKGIVAALEGHIRKTGAPVRMEPAPGFADRRYDADVEACVYFCCLQAIQNVMRHAAGASCTVAIGDDGACITVVMSDDGPGFDPASSPAGMGTQIMQDRVDALEGELTVVSAPGRGTTVRIKVPSHRVVVTA